MGGELGSPDADKIAKTIGVQKPTFLPDRTLSSKLRATWLGHACYYVEYPSGLRVLFDPVFEDRCSPFSFVGPKRHTPRPCDIADLPFVDAVVISHSHYDHLSNPTVCELAKRHPEAHFFVGLGLETWFRSSGIKNVTELDWWETADMTLAPKSQSEGGKTGESITARISCLPAQHCSSRRPGDYNTTLWCSWAVSSSSPSSPESRSVYFGGDTGYRHVPRVPAVEATDETRNPAADFEPPYDTLPVCPQFAQIGELRGPFDLGLLPIGAYKPRYLFSHMHANPFDSVDIFRDTKCKRAMGIHWGTWTLTSEELDEPPKLLKMALKRKGMPETGVFDVCDIGESREF
jgi:L-ascorbate metabolism protein UlaG (beta-lactamase superfamily)